MTITSPSVRAAQLQLLHARRDAHPAVRSNGVVPIILVVAVVVLLALGATIVIGAVALCAANGGVLDSGSLSEWTVKVSCHKL